MHANLLVPLPAYPLAATRFPPSTAHTHTHTHTHIRAKNYGSWMGLELELAIARGVLVTRDKQLATRGPPLECTHILPIQCILSLLHLWQAIQQIAINGHDVTYLWPEIGLADSFSSRLSLLILLVFALSIWLPFIYILFASSFCSFFFHWRRRAVNWKIGIETKRSKAAWKITDLKLH